MLKCIYFLLITGISFTTFGQNNQKPFVSKDSSYNENIRKSRLYNVYIPRDIDDALAKLIELTDQDARNRLLTIDENTMAKNYILVWEGGWSTIGILKKVLVFTLPEAKGLIFTEDMTRFMLIIFHRHISQKELKSEEIIAKLSDERKKKLNRNRKNDCNSDRKEDYSKND